jgi:hypothetical protein
VVARARRSAGTNTYVNRLLCRKPRPELDIENFRNSVVFKVTGLIKPLAAGAVTQANPSGLAGGYLHIGQGRPVAWQGRGSAPMTLTGPFELHEMSDGKLPFGAGLTKCLFSTGQGDFELTVPTTDLDLVRLGWPRPRKSSSRRRNRRVRPLSRMSTSSVGRCSATPPTSP